MDTLVNGYKIYIASNFALYLKTHGAHFNVTGMLFPQLHGLFKDQYEDLWNAHDLIGENIRKLDAFTPAGLLTYSKSSIIDGLDTVLSAEKYIERLFMDHERMIILINTVFHLAEDEDRQDHMNFCADRLNAHNKHRWMLKTLLHGVK